MPYPKVISMFLILAVTIGIVHAAKSQPLKRYSWKNRPLIIFAAHENSQELLRQRRIIRSHIAGFHERDMVVIEIAGSHVRSRLGERPSVSAEILRSYYGVGKQQFRVILVGKDGGNQLQSTSAIHASRLFRLIDSMPMRQQEMRDRSTIVDIQ